MPQWLFEIACVVVVALTLAVSARRRPLRSLLADYAVLALAGWIAEETCIEAYRFYSYAPVWSVFVHHLPLLVPLIWPLVILSARDVVESLWPRAGRWSHALVGAVVAFDASLVEVVAVRAGLWSWAEPGHLNVPVIGMLGWGCFAVGASTALSLRPRWRHVGVLVLGPLATHTLILATWWGFFRWVVRGDLGHASIVGMLLIGAVATAAVWATRRSGNAMPRSVAGPRMIAAGLFFALLLTTAAGEVAYWLHVLALSVPYFAATDLRARCSRATPTAATPPCR